MYEYQINSALHEKALYKGNFKTFRACVEQAVLDAVDLRGADFSNRNLLNAQLDGGNFSHANFANCNLSGANASECILTDANFSDTILFGTVLCESNMKGVNFSGASFGGTEVFDSTLDHCIFSTLSTFKVNLTETASMKESCFINSCGRSCPMTRPPLVIYGLQQPVILLDQHMKIGYDVYEFERCENTALYSGLEIMNLRLRLEQYAAFKCMRLQA